MPDKLSLSEALAQLNEERVTALVKQQIADGVPPTEIVAACQAGLAQVGNRYEMGEYFISELMYAGEIMKAVMQDLEPLLRERTWSASCCGAPATTWWTSGWTSRPSSSSRP